ncbi:type VI secretion system baseplate subunit TssK [Escherichia coli]|uniref:type VI secretion system baseplate subunit TssK n=3 Tax=Escherichia coli TaxID=562 RepID=UPI000CDB72A1|nr:type VI secretion system baseplate subunit TssK [Escherichia coli]EFA8124553.1 type VI secretion system baseplate subunit TssK [Escherichia coli]EII2919763.1 type VI secretion system baseplate subunit TssK [Escherichia coli]EJT6703074.1 type VI secretion system baseplate subunit TssK [Escherichia coli]EKJ3251458.1 type VI secretion system baseplate subunit TssK [Escherichia coli]EKW8702850.1 type VI secretion system baseplate subunit TssK [Escherichia coli]
MQDVEQLVYWYSGLYLQPQHFQSIDLHHSFMLARTRQLSQPHYQGYYECRINEELLKEDTVRIEKIKAVLSSGYYIEYPGNCVVQDKCLTNLRGTDTSIVNLWLALKRFNSAHKNVSSANDKRGSTRWVSSDDESNMRNVYHDSQDTDVTRIRYDIQIITDEEKDNTTDMEYLPLTRIIHNNNTLCIDNECSFPAMRLSANSKLRDRIAEIYSDIEFYKNKLKAYRYTERTVSDGHLYDLLILCAINKTLPLLSSFIKEDAVHPWLHYIALCQFAGEISAYQNSVFSDTRIVDLSYNHYDQISCFSNLQYYIKTMLDNLCRDKIFSFEFKKTTTDTLVCDFDDYSSINNSDHYIKLTSDTFKESNLIALPEIKIAPSEHIDLIIQHALPGINFTVMDVVTSELQVRENIIWLKIDKHSELWKLAQAQKSVSFYWSCSPDDLLVELVLSQEKNMQ